jgi:hypothetical protein
MRESPMAQTPALVQESLDLASEFHDAVIEAVTTKMDDDAIERISALRAEVVQTIAFARIAYGADETYAGLLEVSLEMVQDTYRDITQDLEEVAAEAS